MKTTLLKMTFFVILAVIVIFKVSDPGWDAIGYRVRSDPDRTNVPLGNFATEEEARAVGLAFAKSSDTADYVLYKRGRAGGYSYSTR